MLVFGRSKGDRRAYKQWEEDNIAPQVVFDVVSLTKTVIEIHKKWQFYVPGSASGVRCAEYELMPE